MSLYLTFEELTALNTSATDVLATNAVDGGASHGVAAPPQVIAEIEQLVPQLTGDITLTTLDKQRLVQRTVRHLALHARRQMEDVVIVEHPAHEAAVAAYFVYAHLLTVGRKLETLDEEMTALIKLMSSDDPESEAGRRFSFPD